MIVSNFSQTSHPKFFRYVTVEMPKVAAVAVIAQAMQKNGFLNAAAFKSALSPQHPPRLHLVPNLHDAAGKKVWGYTPPTPPVMLNGMLPPANSILLEKLLADEFEAKGGPRMSDTSADPAVNRKVIKAGSTILHELCHWGDWRAHGKFTDTGQAQEHGAQFEFDVYGALL